LRAPCCRREHDLTLSHRRPFFRFLAGDVPYISTKEKIANCLPWCRLGRRPRNRTRVNLGRRTRPRRASAAHWRVGGAGSCRARALRISITTARFGPRGRRLRAPAPETAGMRADRLPLMRAASSVLMRFASLASRSSMSRQNASGASTVGVSSIEPSRARQCAHGRLCRRSGGSRPRLTCRRSRVSRK
jgi:hypothetical protein